MNKKLCIDCLQMDDGHKLGFFNSEADVRPGHALWITKDEAERLFQLFNKPEVTQCDLSQNNKKEYGIPTTNELAGILEVIL